MVDNNNGNNGGVSNINGNFDGKDNNGGLNNRNKRKKGFYKNTGNEAVSKDKSRGDFSNKSGSMLKGNRPNNKGNKQNKDSASTSRGSYSGKDGSYQRENNFHKGNGYRKDSSQSRNTGGGYSYRNSGRARAEETVEDIKSDIVRIEKEIMLEIKEIRGLKLGV